MIKTKGEKAMREKWRFSRINGSLKMTRINYQENHIEIRGLTAWEKCWHLIAYKIPSRLIRLWYLVKVGI